MQTEDLISIYTKNAFIKNLANKISQLSNASCGSTHIKGLVGSLPAIIGGSLYVLTHNTQVFIVQDKEEAAYLYTDLYNLFKNNNIFLYPAIEHQYNTISYISTSSNLLRNEVLQALNKQGTIPQLIITYPEAISTQVLQPSILAQNTWTIHKGEEIILLDLINKLLEKGFEKVDFVYEAGQFAIRGGIIDIFSYANQLPYRIELFVKEVENIRTFNPSTQISIEALDKAHIFSYNQDHDINTNYQSFLEFLPNNTWIWFKDYETTFNVIKSYTDNSLKLKAQHEVKEELMANTISYEHPQTWEKEIQNFICIEFGNRFYLPAKEIIEYKSLPQPSFNRQFKLLANSIHENYKTGLENIIISESASQLDTLTNTLAQIDTSLQYRTLQLGLTQGFIDNHIGIACYTDHQIFGRYYKYKSPEKYTKSQALTLKQLNTLQTGDYVVHIDYGIARFAGLSKVHTNDKEQEVLRLVYKDNDVVYLSLHALHKISKYTGKEGFVPTISKLGTSAWEQKKNKVKTKVQDIAKELIQLYSKRKHSAGFAFSKDTFLQAELESSFMYEDTPDQAAATEHVKTDMESSYPMDRLVCGDVGFGKTEIAIRAAFKAIQDLKQVAVLVPTTILALQHYESFKNRLANFPIKIQYINRFKTKQEITKIRQAAAKGEIDVIIGTHMILGKSFEFYDLGLLIVDEEQKFGVKVKDRIKQLKINVDILTLTATPIPRTLHFSLMGARDLSIISTPPPNRQPVHTSIHTFDKKVIQEAIHYEVQRGGQVFFVHNRVANIEEVANMIHKLVPEYRIGIAHGQMDGDKLEKKMLNFIKGDYDILVSTNIIESGLDIPNANTIIINDSHMFGLSDLHQMRGRVGRSNKRAFCYLIAPPSHSLTAEARKRLSTLEEFSELGDGFKVAMRDLDIRGAGDLLGAEQSGFIADVGFEAYCKILEEAVQELKDNEFKDLFKQENNNKPQLKSIDCILETDLELLIPSTYINNDTERLRIYTKIDNAVDQTELNNIQKEIQDRFGPMPLAAQELIKAVKLRWLAKNLGLQKIKLKDGVMGCYFSSIAQKSSSADMLSQILKYIHKNPNTCQLKELKSQLLLSINNIRTIEQAQEVIQDIAKELG